MNASNLTVDVARLRRGMFVAALDRPWDTTKFLFQGFLIESEQELDALREQCSWVVVDLTRSDPDATLGLAPPRGPREDRRSLRRPRGATAALPEPLAVESRPLVPYHSKSRQARLKRSQLLLKRTARKTVPMPDERRPAEVPRWEPLVEYVDEADSLQQDLPRARAAARTTRLSLKKFAQEILNKGELQVQKIEEAASDLTECIIENPNALHWLVRTRESDASTYQHNIKVAVYLLTLGRHLGYPPQRLVEFATIGLLLDVGKLFVDRALLAKAGPLDAQELARVRQHVDLGLEALTKDGELSEAVVHGIAQHHERLDGSGYPKALAGTAISMEGRMAAIADSFSAMTSSRPYAPVLTAYHAMRELYRRSDSHYQESLVDKFVEAVGIFPVGGLVELSTGEVAVVVRHNRQRRLEPNVLVITNSDRHPLEAPFELDLLMQKHPSAQHKLVRIARALQPGEFDVDLSALYLG